MRFYLEGDSLLHQGYVPDWLKVSYVENEKTYEITLDIRGEISYSKTKLSCSVKGDFIPWTLIDEDGEEIDLTSVTEEESLRFFSNEKIICAIENAESYCVGLALPYDDDDERWKQAESDVLTNCSGLIVMHHGSETLEEYRKQIIFDTELNYY